MLNKDFWTQVNNKQAEYDKSRRIIISRANEALHLSKQTIFALHRDNQVEAEEMVKKAQEILLQLEKDFGQNKKLRYEGSWIAGMEEFAEARLFLNYVKGEEVSEIEDIHLEPNEYLGGICDYTGELVRRAVLFASERKIDEVKEISEEIHDVVHKLLEYNLTGPLRQKFDQAKRNMQRIEQIIYEINLK